MPRTVDYTLPFGTFGGLGAQGFQLTAAHVTAATPEPLAQLASAGIVSHSPVRVTAAAFEAVFCSTTATTRTMVMPLTCRRMIGTASP